MGRENIHYYKKVTYKKVTKPIACPLIRLLNQSKFCIILISGTFYFKTCLIYCCPPPTTENWSKSMCVYTFWKSYIILDMTIDFTVCVTDYHLDYVLLSRIINCRNCAVPSTLMAFHWRRKSWAQAEILLIKKQNPSITL